MENGEVRFPPVCSYGGSNAFTRPEQGRKKRVRPCPWTEEEHKLFLLGLKKYGKGDWRNISRNFVQTKTPTQVASHAHKFFIRLNSSGKDRKRSSTSEIITTVNLTNDQPVPSASQSFSLITDQFSTLALAPDANQNGRVNSPSN